MAQGCFSLGRVVMGQMPAGVGWSMGSRATMSSSGHVQHSEDGELAWQQKDVLQRESIQKFVARSDFGKRLCGSGRRAAIYDAVAAHARGKEKVPNVVTTIWELNEESNWMQRPANLRPRSSRPNFKCYADVYSYGDKSPNALVVDFANQYVGGGCFGGGFVQEEQMVVQSTDFAVTLHQHREVIGPRSAVSYEGVHFDAWWTRAAASEKERLSPGDIQPCAAPPLTILAVDAPEMAHYRGGYSKQAFLMLATKVMLIFKVAQALNSPEILSGLLGGGAFRNNRPLVLLLHLPFQPADSDRVVHFYHPIFWSFCRHDVDYLEKELLDRADSFLADLAQRGVETLEQALTAVYNANFPTSQYDHDLIS